MTCKSKFCCVIDENSGVLQDQYDLDEHDHLYLDSISGRRGQKGVIELLDYDDDNHNVWERGGIEFRLVLQYKVNLVGGGVSKNERPSVTSLDLIGFFVELLLWEDGSAETLSSSDLKSWLKGLTFAHTLEALPGWDDDAVYKIQQATLYNEAKKSIFSEIPFLRKSIIIQQNQKSEI